MFAGQQVVERLLESVATFSFRPKRLVVVDNSIEIAPFFADVTEDMAGGLAIRVNPNVNRPDNQ